MMQSKENKGKLFRLMAIWGEITPGEKPTPEKMEGYYRIACISEFDFDAIEKRGNQFIKTQGFFPKINDLFNDEQSMTVQIQEDVALLEHLCQEFLWPGFYESGMNVIQTKLEESGKEYLFSSVKRFGDELADQKNITATRAQLRDYLKANNERRRLEITSGNGKQAKLIEDLDKIK